MNATAAPSPASITRSRAIYGLLILTLINLFNYLDRQMMAAVLPNVARDFQLNGKEAGALTSVFVIIYMVVAPLGGYLGDRMPRRLLVAISIWLWSLATVASGLVTSYGALLVARGIVGIGEAGYGAAAPSIIADLFSPQKRSSMLSYFYLAMPLGAGAGYMLGGWLSETYSWHTAFFVGGVPGLLLGIAMLVAPEPKRGGSEHDASHAEKLPFSVGVRQLTTSPLFWINTTGYTLLTFTIGGLGAWMPTFLQQERGQNPTRAGLVFGAITLIGGLVGTLIGGLLGDWAEKRRAGGGMWVSGIGLVAAAPFVYLAAVLPDISSIYAVILLVMILLFLNTGPINAAVLNSVAPAFRSFAMGVNMLLIHLLGDAASPVAIGAIKDVSNLSTAIIMNAVPVLLGGVVLLGGATLWRGSRKAPATAPGA